MANILDIENVTRIFRGAGLAMGDVTLGVGEGEFLTTLGPPGRCKTVTRRMVGGG
jgi:ABC-type Fe3+/spermidine/putrescine transport system ATPase subunit